MKRNLMLILLAALLAVGLVGVSAPAARADDTVYTEGTLYYTIANESITITGCFGRDAEIHVPAMIAGIPVNTIAAGAFANNENVKTVYLPDTISKVEPGAFGEGVRVIYNANTDHPQDTPTDLILGLLTPAATDDPNATEPPAEPTEPPAEPTEPPAAPTPTQGSGTEDIPATTPKPTATPVHGSGSEEFGATAAPTRKPAATQKPAATPKVTEAPTEEPLPSVDVGAIGEVTENGTVIAEVEVEFGDEDPTPAPTEVPAAEAPKATDAPKVAEVKATDAPVKPEPVATAEPAPAEAGRGSGWIWGVVGAAAVIAGAAVLVKKRRKA